MLFYGINITAEKPVQEEVADDVYLILTQAILKDPTDEEETKLNLETDSSTFMLACFDKNTTQVKLEILLEGGKSATLSVSGKGQIDVTGYYCLKSEDTFDDEDDNMYDLDPNLLMQLLSGGVEGLDDYDMDDDDDDDDDQGISFGRIEELDDDHDNENENESIGIKIEEVDDDDEKDSEGGVQNTK
eukprot:TRINITY_DN2225_c0_g1_i4.p1 TRINITY_DN2225_c0_g1~~TRINITY_DN2225_c0_g1_i4.p1  ORF type:complete len:187 (-),score=52.43 TRINITY_DN2225_c0_g1_i4:101-661(-)